MRTSRGIAERKIREQETRHADIFNNVLAQPITTVAMPLSSSARCQAHALVANRAIGKKKRGIDLILRAAAHDLEQSTSIVTRWLRLVGRP